MSDLLLLGVVLPSPRLPQRRSRSTRVFICSLLFHVAAAALLAAMSFRVNPSTPSETPHVARSTMETPRIVFVQMPRPPGGGGGGGNRQATPPSRARAIGRDRVTVPAVPAVVPQLQSRDVMLPHRIALSALPLAAGTTYAMGTPEASDVLAGSLGPGTGQGVGDGAGTGIGSGKGPGLGPGSGGGFGGGAYRPGNGVTAPTLLMTVTPRYTSEAMARKLQGTVVLEAVVGRDGIPSAIRVIRSLDPGGLDDEALRATRQWRFLPGYIGETPVDVLVTIVLDFHIR